MPNATGGIRSVVLAAFVLAACGRIAEMSSTEGAPFPSERGDAGPVANDAAADADEDAAPSRSIVYASAKTGNDANDGFSPSSAKRTLTAAVAAASAAHAEVHACAGDYVEKDFSLSDSVSLFGAYDCTTWKRTPTYGAPTFDGVNETRIERATSSSLDGTFVVTGASITRAVIVDGFTVLGRSPNDVFRGGSALHVTDNAAPTITNDKLVGGAGGKETSIGVFVDGRSSPDLGFDEIKGGVGGQIKPSDPGSPPCPASIGLQVFSANPHVHDSVIDAGTGVCPEDVASIAALINGDPNADPRPPVRLTSVDGTAFERNVVLTGPSGQNADGLMVGWVDAADILDNVIHGSAVGRPSTSIDLPASIYASTTIRVVSNKIYGGLGDDSFALRVDGVTDATIANNMIHGGNAGAGAALYLVDSSAPLIAFNTLYSGSQATEPIGTGHSSIQIAGSVNGHGLSDAVIVDNLFVGTGDGGASVAFDASFPETFVRTIAEFSNNAFARQGGPLVTSYDGTDYATTSDLEAAINGATVDGGIPPHASGNVVTSADLTTLFVSFSDPPDDGVSDLFGAGWKLKLKAPCAVAHGGTPTIPASGAPIPIVTDLYGTSRSATTPSIGASELMGVCDVP